MKQQKLAFLILTLLISSCASPEHDGEKHAQEECEVWDTYIQNTITAYTNFVKEFGSKNYQTRTEARKELEKRLDEVETKLASKSNELDAKFSALLEKYDEDQDKSDAMYKAYNNVMNAYQMDTTRFAGLRSQANNKILSIIPPDPSIDKLQKDLIGRRIKALPGGYLNSSWSWTIAPGEIKDMRIIDKEDFDRNHKEITINMTLQADGAAYKSTGKVYYVLDNRDDWEIDMLEPSEVEIVKTGRYDSSIKSSFSKLILGERIVFQNISDAALLVGFRTLDNYGNYTKHSRMISGGETITHTDLGIKDYTIDFVEKP